MARPTLIMQEGAKCPGRAMVSNWMVMLYTLFFKFPKFAVGQCED